MRYGHMVRTHHSTLPPPPSMNNPRKFRPITKRANTFALDIRHALTSSRATLVVIILLSLPFLTAIFNFLARSSSATTSSDGLQTVKSSSSATLAATVSSTSSDHQHLKPPPDSIPSLSRPIDPKPIDVTAYLSKLTARRKQAKVSGRSVTLIASCHGMHKSLAMSFPSWSAQPDIDHIVIVDSSKASTFEWHKIPHFSDMMQSGRLTVVLADTATWALSRAYNLAAEFATGDYVLKVDCDTYLKDDFLAKHPPPTDASYYTVSWGSARNENEERLKGVWFARLSDFRNVGGYDERIARYGFEDTDLYNRFNNRATLTAKPLNLDTLRHNIAPALMFQTHEDDFLISRRMSIRAHEALVASLPKWPDVQKGLRTTYTFSYDEGTSMVFANVTRPPPDPYAEKSEAEREALLKPVLQAGLHDEFNIPWDIIPSISYDDLRFLARYLDDETQPHVVVALLEGQDSLSNLFNLVSVVQLAMTVGRPMVVIWNAPGGATVSETSNPLQRELFDMAATNAQMANAAKEEVVQKLRPANAAVENIRLIAADKWKCVEGLAACGEKYDKAYSSFSEVTMHVAHVYDETEPLPIALSRHTLLRLTDVTKIGNPETRKLAYKTIVQAGLVRDAEQEFVVHAKLGIVAEGAGEIQRIARDVQSGFPDLVSAGAKQLVPIVGPLRAELRKKLFGAESLQKFCDGGDCSLKQVAVDVANVFVMCEAEAIYPKKELGSERSLWTVRSDVSYMMIADLCGSDRG